MRKLLIALAILLGLLVAADFGLRLVAQRAVAGDLQSALSLRDRPSVSLGGFPFVAELASGTVSSVTVHTRGPVHDGDLRFESAALALRDVRFSAGQLLGGNGTTIRAGHGGGTATITESELNAAIRATAPVTVAFREPNIVVRSDLGGLEVEAHPVIEGGRLVLRPVNGSLPELRVALPEVVPGLTYTDVRIEGDRAILSFALRNAVFETSARTGH